MGVVCDLRHFVRREIIVTLPCGPDDRLPPFGRDAVALPPLTNRLGLGTDALREDIRRRPAIDDLSETLRHGSPPIGLIVLGGNNKLSRDHKDELRQTKRAWQPQPDSQRNSSPAPS